METEPFLHHLVDEPYALLQLLWKHYRVASRGEYARLLAHVQDHSIEFPLLFCFENERCFFDCVG